LLIFDKRFDEGVPHDKPDVIRAFLVKKFAGYIAGHPNELREMQDPSRELTGKRLPPRMQTLTTSQWVEEKVAVAEELLARKTCAQCHGMALQKLPDTGIARWATSQESVNAGQMAPGRVAPVLPQRFRWSQRRIRNCSGCHMRNSIIRRIPDLLA